MVRFGCDSSDYDIGCDGDIIKSCFIYCCDDFGGRMLVVTVIGSFGGGDDIVLVVMLGVIVVFGCYFDDSSGCGDGGNSGCPDEREDGSGDSVGNDCGNAVRVCNRIKPVHYNDTSAPLTPPSQENSINTGE